MLRVGGQLRAGRVSGRSRAPQNVYRKANAVVIREGERTSWKGKMHDLGGYQWMHDGTKGPIEHQKGFMRMRARAFSTERALSTESDSAIVLLQRYHEAMDDLTALETNATSMPMVADFYSDVVQPLRRTYAWAIPTRAALECIARHSPHGVVEVGAGTGYWAHLLASRCGVDVAAYDETPCIDTSAGIEDHASGEKREEVLNGFHALVTSGNALPFTHVLRGDAAIAADHPQRALLLCWPPKEAAGGGGGGGGTGAADGESNGAGDHDGAGDGDGAGGLTAAQASMASEALRSFGGDTVLYVGCHQEAAAEVAATEAAVAKAESGRTGTDGGSTRVDTAGPRFHSDLEATFERLETVPLPCWPQARDTLTVWRRRSSGGGRGGGKGDGSHGDAASRATTFNACAEESIDAQVDHVTRELTLAILRSSFDRRWMVSLFARCVRSRLLPVAGIEVSDAERRMLDRCLGRLSLPWAQRAGKLAKSMLL